MENPFACHSSLDSAIMPLSGCLWYWLRPEDLFPNPFVHRGQDLVAGGRSLKNRRWCQGTKTPKAVMRLCAGFRVVTTLLLPTEQWPGIWREAIAFRTSHLSLILSSASSSSFLFLFQISLLGCGGYTWESWREMLSVALAISGDCFVFSVGWWPPLQPWELAVVHGSWYSPLVASTWYFCCF